MGVSWGCDAAEAHEVGSFVDVLLNKEEREADASFMSSHPGRLQCQKVIQVLLSTSCLHGA